MDAPALGVRLLIQPVEPPPVVSRGRPRRTSSLVISGVDSCSTKRSPITPWSRARGVHPDP